MNKMKITQLFIFLSIVILLVNCKVKPKGIDLHNNMLYTDIISGKVKSIKEVESIQEVVFEQKNKNFLKILIPKSKIGNFNFLIDNRYTIKANKLLSTYVKSEKIIINEKEVILSPNLIIEKCIYFCSQKFCETSIEIFEGLKIIN